MRPISTPATDPGLAAALRDGEVVLFIGAGLSAAAGLPTWDELVVPWAMELQIDPDAHLDPLDTAQQYENAHGRNALLRSLRSAFDCPDVKPTVLHSIIAGLGELFFTTNYDALLETAIRHERGAASVTVSDLELAYISSRAPQVVKLCGDISRPESIVVTRRDMNTFGRTRPRLAQFVDTALQSKVPLFLGYSFRDPFINVVWDVLGNDFGKHRRPGYIVLLEPDASASIDFEQRALHVIALSAKSREERTQQLADWLFALRGHPHDT